MDETDKVSRRYESRLRHIGWGRKYSGQRIIVMTAGRDARVLIDEGKLKRTLRLDPSRDYQRLRTGP